MGVNIYIYKLNVIVSIKVKGFSKNMSSTI